MASAPVFILASMEMLSGLTRCTK